MIIEFFSYFCIKFDDYDKRRIIAKAARILLFRPNLFVEKRLDAARACQPLFLLISKDVLARDIFATVLDVDTAVTRAHRAAL